MVSDRSFTTITFPSRDGLKVTADWYQAEQARGCILLCHRSHFNRGEYREIAPRLAKLGFDCLAIDQRSGMNVLGTINETSTLAKKQKLPTGYLDARPDIEAAIDVAFEKSAHKPIIILGSSYSASLALLLAIGHHKIKAVAAFSPGEYLKGVSLAEKLRAVNVPLFITAAKNEMTEVDNLMRAVPKRLITRCKPRSEGAHGARALWAKSVGHEEYWKALEKFLKDN